jgi:hypothetical protein
MMMIKKLLDKSLSSTKKWTVLVDSYQSALHMFLSSRD